MIIRKSSNGSFQLMERVQLDEFDIEKIRKMERNLSEIDLQKVKEKSHKGMDLWSEFLRFDNEDVIRLILSYVQNKCIMFDKPYPITKDIILVVIGMCNSGSVLVKKIVKNKEVETLFNVIGDQKALLIDKISHPVVRYVAYEISYKIYFKNRESSTLAITVYVAHKISMEDAMFDLCELLKDQL